MIAPAPDDIRTLPLEFAPMQIAPEIFKAYDIRGVVGRSLTAEAATAIGRALGSEARARGQQAIVIGRDGRLSGPMLVGALAKGLQRAGCDVIDIGMVPTGVAYFAGFHLGVPSTVAVTGSHNPPDYNGFKMVLGGETLSGEAIQRLKVRIENGDFTDGKGGYSETSILDPYVARVVGDLRVARPLNLVVDCGNGVAGALAPRLFRQLGCEVVELFCEVDGEFPNHHPDPSQPENLEDLIRAVKASRADLGFAFDGDGDRLGVISGDGTVIWPDRQLILFAREILKRRPGAEFIYDVKCSRNLPRAIEAAGGRATMWRTGHSFIKAKLRESGAALAGEMSGHLFFNDRWYGFDDGLYAGARLLELLSRDPRPPVEVFRELPDSVNTPELRIEFPEGENFAAMRQLAANAHFPGAQVSTVDGLRVDYPDGFGLVRASNTTPILVLRFEGENAQALGRIQNDFRSLIRAVRPEAAIPF
jgi:phosphomannomutase/phosphoglucomutase